MPKKIDLTQRGRAVRLVLNHLQEYPALTTVCDATARQCGPGNAPAESISGLFNTERLRTTVFHSGPFKTIADVKYTIAG